jgi:folate-binding protein YgfZ
VALKQDNSRGYAALRERAAVVDRTGYGRLLLTGADRRAYLQGLLTNDIEALTPGTGCYAAMLNAQGRMLTDMRVLELGDAVLLDVPLQVTAAIRDHLDNFIFSDDVKVEDVTTSRVEIGLYGPRALEILQSAGTDGAAPSSPFGVTRVRIAGADALLVATDGSVPGYEVISTADNAAVIRQALMAAGAETASEDDFETLRIERGRPRFGADMTEDTIPLEAGLEERAISRTKGCYVGQEVSVRGQDRGHGRVARKLVGLTFAADSPIPAAGAVVHSGDREIGRVTSATWSPALARPIALGYVHRDFVDPGTRVSVAGADGVVAMLPMA